MRKKGISPLIATVLLIGLTVALSASVIMWGRGIYDERKEKQGTISEVQFDCSIDIGFDILSSEFSSDDPDINLYTRIENTGKKDIDGFRIRVLGSNQDYSISDNRTILSKSTVKDISIYYDKPKIGNPIEATFVPMFKVGADQYLLCEDSGITVNVAMKE